MGDRAGAVEERAVRLEVNGRTIATWTASPGQAQALGAGRLLAEGYIRGPRDLLALSLEETDDLTLIRARVRAAGAGSLPLDAPPGSYPRPAPPRAPLPPLDVFPALFRQLFASAERSADTGGLHSAALSDGATLRHRVEEVGRHNAVDKAIGLALLAGDDLSRLGLVISARISGDMARKAAAAGLAWIASRSVPTTLAVAVAEERGMPIVARAAGKDARVFGGP
jgi:FdhD protein